MTGQVVENYQSDVIKSFRDQKRKAELAMDQISDEEFFAQIDPESNSIAIIVKHVAGNLRSRWTDLLMSDGEKPDRFRDGEFITLHVDSRIELMSGWESGWSTLFNAIEPLTIQDFSRTVTIRGEPHTVVEAMNRQLTHYALHIGQIIFLAKHFRSSKWRTLSVPRNRSVAFNEFLAGKQAKGGRSANRSEDIEEFANLDKKQEE